MPIKINPLLTIVLFVCFVNWQNVQAAVIDDLYDAKIAVSNQSEQIQNNAFSQALQQVLVKVRGNNDLLTNETIKTAMSKATRFVRAYSYDMQASQLYLVISFDPQRVENLVRNAGFPVWDKRRPDSIVWLAIKPSDYAARQIARLTEYSEIYQQLRLRAKQRGITLIFPVWDIEDIQSLEVYDIWGGFSAQISQASERYGVPSILSARMYLSDTQSMEVDEGVSEINAKWSADWTMVEGGALLSGQVQGDDPLIIAELLIDALADQLSVKYAIDLTQFDRTDTKVQIVVNNIDSLNYYQQTILTLENMSVVNRATLIKQQGTRATFELDLLGDLVDLTNSLKLESKIRPVIDDFGQPILGLEFFWVK